jgi:maltose alpha-D-glucosyltransferase/alpha-amylase
MSDSGLLPGDTSRDALLEAFLLEKGLYELSYELGSRPDWIDIPLTGLLQLLEPSDAARPAGAVSF